MMDVENIFFKTLEIQLRGQKGLFCLLLGTTEAEMENLFDS